MKKLVFASAILAVAAGFAFAQHDGTHHGSMDDKHNMDANAKVETPQPAYPIDFCVVSGEKLGEMGSPVVKTYNGREVQFCCNSCVKNFDKNPEGYLKKLNQAIIEKETATYPLKTCLVTDEELGGMGDPIEYVYNNHLVRFCCSMCIRKFEAEPSRYLKKLDDARMHPDSTN